MTKKEELKSILPKKKECKECRGLGCDSCIGKGYTLVPIYKRTKQVLRKEKTWK